MFDWHLFSYTDFNKINLDWIADCLKALTGGNTEQILSKKSGENFDFEWVNKSVPGTGLTEEIKQALLQLAQKVAYIDDQGQTYYQDLYNALYGITPVVTLVSIDAAYTQSGTVYDTDTLDSLKADLVVTATYSDSSTAVIPAADYTLTGTLTVGSSVITVSYDGKTDTFNVTVTENPAPPVTLVSIDAVYTQSGTVYDTDTLDSLKADLVVTATYSDSTTAVIPAADYTLTGTLTVGSSVITVSYEGKTDTFNVTVTAAPLVPSTYQRIEYATRPESATVSNYVEINVKLSGSGTAVFDFEFMRNSGTSITYPIAIRQNISGTTAVGFGVGVAGDNLSYYSFAGGNLAAIDSETSIIGEKITAQATINSTGWTISDGEDTATVTGEPRDYSNQNIHLFGLRKHNAQQISYGFVGRIYYVKVTENNVVKTELIPCKRISDSAVGFWDRINEAFYTSSVLEAGPDVA